MKKHKWEQLTALDKGDSIQESSTFRSYGVSGVDQIVVISRTGVIQYNGGESKHLEGNPMEMEAKLGLKKATSRKEALENALKVFEHVYSKEIDDALGQKSSTVKQRAGITPAKSKQTK